MRLAERRGHFIFFLEYSMDRRSIIKNAGLAGVFAAGVGPAIVHAQAAVRWRLTSAFPKSLDTIFGAADTFARKVKDMSGGKFEISTHAAGELVPMPGLVDAVQNGTVEMGHTAPYYYFGKNDAFALGCAIPFGLNSRQMTAWQYDGNGLKLMREFYAGYGFTSFPMGNTGAQMGGWYRKEIKTVADMKGLKFRVGGFAGKVTSRLGTVSQNIPGAKSIPRSKKARSTLPSGSALTMTKSSASTKLRRSTTTPAGGKAAPSLTCSSTRRRSTPCRPNTRPSSRQLRPMHTPKCKQSTMPATRVL